MRYAWKLFLFLALCFFAAGCAVQEGAPSPTLQSERIDELDGSFSLRESGWARGLRLSRRDAGEGDTSLAVEVLAEGDRVIHTVAGDYRSLTRYGMADLDGDGTDDLILLLDTKGSGGMGSHELIILSPDGGGGIGFLPVPGEPLYSGFAVAWQPMEGCRARITCPETNYAGTLDIPGGSPIRELFDAQGDPLSDEKGTADSIYDFSIVEQGNGVALETRQYVWQGEHVNHVGDWIARMIWLPDGYMVVDQDLALAA